ncbi:MAG: bifunctional indole-3-glycerol-phosphate synthase TrpC/phosphoribosylanthranilate isomerase TrpF, partial [Planctomycetota bacterium]
MLAEILRHKRAEVADRQRRRSVAELEARSIPTKRSLAEALRAEVPSFIFECKRKSPSAGTLRERFEVSEIANCYGRHAQAISVLTDTTFFGAEPDDLERVRASVDLPILAKDFVIDRYQVQEARIRGADAILLILAALDDATLRHCVETAKDLAMDCLFEVHDEHELERALAFDAPLIGINSRNLKTLEIDLGVVERLAPRVPHDRCVIAESGIRSHVDVRSLREGVDVFLVGSSLMRETDLEGACRRLLHGRVKICGLTDPRDAVVAAEAGASEGGLIFAPESPRAVTVDQAASIVTAASLDAVGVFVNERAEPIARIARQLRLGAVQLHGEESPADVERLRS